MAIKQLQKSVRPKEVSIAKKDVETRTNEFISMGGSLAAPVKATVKESIDTDHRLTLRIPNWLLEKVDRKRKQRVGSISRNLWILELIEKETRD